MTHSNNDREVRVCLIDCDDSYTLNIADYIRQCDAKVDVVSHLDVSIELLEEKNFQAIVLSPGPKKPSEVPILFDIIRYFDRRIPILGICLGHQAIGIHYGMQLSKSSFPIHGSPVEITLSDDPIFQFIKGPFYAMRYNSLTIDPEGISPLEIICRDKYGEVMGFKHRDLPVYSFQFHPESIGTPQGIHLFKKWIDLIQTA